MGDLHRIDNVEALSVGFDDQNARASFGENTR
jgi:hypothetical protein